MGIPLTTVFAWIHKFRRAVTILTTARKLWARHDRGYYVRGLVTRVAWRRPLFGSHERVLKWSQINKENGPTSLILWATEFGRTFESLVSSH